MLLNIQDYFTFEVIYIWSTFGVIPFWLILIFLPNTKISQIFVNSIIAPLILAIAYGFVIYQTILMEYSILENFQLYLGLDNLYALFSNENILLTFWLHFLAINLFLGSWVSRDAVKYNISKGLTAVPLILIYLTGPLGLIIYWIIRIFYSKKINFND